jgi:hypothetical protein
MEEANENKANNARQKEIISDILSQLSDPLHKRIVNAYGGEDPVDSMELELGKVLLDIWTDENENKKL